MATQLFSQIKIGVQGGYNISKLSHVHEPNADGPLYTTASINTFQFGGILEMDSKKNMFLQTGLLVSGKGGFIADHSIADGGSETNTRLWYLQLPVNIGMKIQLNKNLHIVFAGGFYAARGVSGTTKGTGFTGWDAPYSYPVNNTVHFTNDASYYKENTTTIKPFDFGYNALAGLEWKNLQFTFNYNNGLTNIYPNDYTNYKNKVFNFSVVYLFQLKK